MPNVIGSACRCGGTRTRGKCDRCDGGHGKHERTTTQRGYGADWQAVSERVRTEQPLCEACKASGIVSATTEVHHKVPIKSDPSRRLDRDNLVGLCESCHIEAEKAWANCVPWGVFLSKKVKDDQTPAFR